jgi:hypothetical protein
MGVPHWLSDANTDVHPRPLKRINGLKQSLARTQIDRDAPSDPRPRQGPAAADWEERTIADLNRVRFGPFLLDFANSRFLRDGAEVRIRPQVYEVIKALASRMDRESSVAELMTEAWKGCPAADLPCGQGRAGQISTILTARPLARGRVKFRRFSMFLARSLTREFEERI